MRPQTRSAQKRASLEKISKKSFWRDRTIWVWSFFCPLCGIPRRVPYRPRPGVRHFLQIGLTAVILMLISWTWFEWRGIVTFLPLWMAFEVIYRSKVRGALACTQCGFDPYLYLNDLPRARVVVENHWRKKFTEKGIPYPEPKRSQTGRVLQGSNPASTSLTLPVAPPVSPGTPAAVKKDPASKNTSPEMAT